MRIAGDHIRRNYLARYEKNYSDKYDSEKKIYSGRQFDKGSENPINAARALRVRRSISEVESYQDNLKTADSIYTNAESAMLAVSGIIQNVYEKLVQGAHGTYNQDDLNIIASDIDNYAEEMVQSLNIDVADRKIFGGMNNETTAFRIEGSEGGKYVTYNGVALNSSNDPQSFPYNGESYLDIGIGMSVDENYNRIDDQTGLPITFNGAECTGCGMTNKTACIALDELYPNNTYKFNISAGGKSADITITIDPTDTTKDKIEKINEQFKYAFRDAPELLDDGSFDNIDSPRVKPYEPSPVENNAIQMDQLKDDTYYSIEVSLNNKTRVIDFLGSTDKNEALKNLDTVLKEKFGDRAYADASGAIRYGYGDTGNIKSRLNGLETAPLTADGKIDFDSLVPGKQYAVNLSTPRTNSKGEVLKDDNGDPIYGNGEMVYFTAQDSKEDTIKNINDYISINQLFGKSEYPQVNESGVITYDVAGANIVLDTDEGSPDELPFTEINGYPKNLIQLVLDAGSYLRKGDQQMVARYADLIFAAQSNLSIAISDLGTHSKFIEFNEDRLENVMIGLKTRQNDLESTKLEDEITNWKVLESVYNASLQMGSSILSQTIFDYIH